MSVSGGSSRVLGRTFSSSSSMALRRSTSSIPKEQMIEKEEILRLGILGIGIKVATHTALTF